MPYGYGYGIPGYGGTGAGADPRSIANLAAWWNARAGNYTLSGGSTIATIIDLSGNGNTLTPRTVAPTLAAGGLNGRDAFAHVAASTQDLKADGLSALFTGVDKPITVIAAAFTTTTTGTSVLWALTRSTTSVYRRMWRNGNALQAGCSTDAATSWAAATNPTAAINTPFVLSDRSDSANTNDRVWKDSVARTGDPQTITATGAITFNQFCVGSQKGGASFWDGQWSEMLVYARALSTDEILRAEQFVRQNNGF